MDEFNTEYYSTAAELIAVFFITMLAQQYWKPPTAMSGARFAVLNLAVVGFVLLGESVAIQALSERETPSRFGDLAIVLAAVLPLVRIGLVLIAEGVRDVSPTLPRWAKELIGWGIVLAAAALLTSQIVGGDPTDVFVAVVSLALLAMFIGGSTPPSFGSDIRKIAHGLRSKIRRK